MATIKSVPYPKDTTNEVNYKSYCQRCSEKIFSEKHGEDGVLICIRCYKELIKGKGVS